MMDNYVLMQVASMLCKERLLRELKNDLNINSKDMPFQQHESICELQITILSTRHVVCVRSIRWVVMIAQQDLTGSSQI